MRRGIYRLTVEALVAEVGKVNDAIVDGVRAAAVFVHGGARVEARRRYVADRAVGRAADDAVAPALRSAAFDPVEVVAVQSDFAQADGAGDDQVRCDGRFPRAAGSNYFFRHNDSSFEKSVRLKTPASSRLNRNPSSMPMLHDTLSVAAMPVHRSQFIRGKLDVSQRRSICL